MLFFKTENSLLSLKLNSRIVEQKDRENWVRIMKVMKIQGTSSYILVDINDKIVKIQGGQLVHGYD